MDALCERNEIGVPDVSACCSARCSRISHDKITVEHRYRMDIFYATLDFQLRELNNRFSEQATQLLRFSLAFDPRYCCKSFVVEDIRVLVKKFYPNNSIDREKVLLKLWLKDYELDNSSQGFA